MNQTSPFTPTFGSSPSVPVGRADIVESFTLALRSGPGSPSRALLLSGTRGVGKTVLLNEVEDAAREQGWAVITETALPGLVNRLVNEHLPALLQMVDPRSTVRRVTGVTGPAGLGGFTGTVHERHPIVPGLSTQLTQALDHLQEHHVGLLITVDEIGRGTTAELAELAAAVQHIFRENRDIALALAGLPDEVNALLKHRGITFIRRADHRELGAVTREEARRGLVEPVEENGWHWDETALNRALEATRGYPFMIQLIGHHSWLAAKNPTVIDDQAVEHGTQRALKDLNTLVLKPLVAELSGLDLAFVKAMAEDPGPSKVSDIAARIDRSADTVAQYRRRLIARHIVVPVSHGVVAFTIPGLREFLHIEEDHAPIPFW